MASPLTKNDNWCLAHWVCMAASPAIVDIIPTLSP